MKQSERKIHFISVDLIDDDTCIIIFERDDHGVSFGRETILYYNDAISFYSNRFLHVL